jgi:hypothetical protein
MWFQKTTHLKAVKRKDKQSDNKWLQDKVLIRIKNNSNRNSF